MKTINNDSSRIIKTTEQKIEALEQKFRVNKTKDRKLETRKKIQLGGLIIKAKLEDIPVNILLGILVDAKKKLNTGESHFEKYWEYLGDLEFNAK